MSANAGERSENAGALAERSASAPPPRVQEASRDEERVGEEDALPPPPLPREDPTPPGALPRISWRRAVGIFHLYLAWLIADAVGLAFALTAIVTDHWIVPTGSALPFVSRVGLWKACFSPFATEAAGRPRDRNAEFPTIKSWWDAVSASYLDVAEEASDLQPGCTRRVAEFYAHVWGRDFTAWLQMIRAFAILFLWTGALKMVVVTRNYAHASAGRWLSSGLAVALAVAQAAFGEAAWFLALAIIQRAQRSAPGSVDREAFEAYEGWSFWAFFASVHWTLCVTSAYLFVELGACCREQRSARFENPARAPDAKAKAKAKAKAAASESEPESERR